MQIQAWKCGSPDTQHWISFYLFQTTQTQFLTNSFQLELKACQTVVIGNICPSCCGFRNNQKSFYFPFQRPKQQLTFLIYNQLFKNIWRAIPFLHLQTDSFFKRKQENLMRSLSYKSNTLHFAGRILLPVTHCFHIIQTQRYIRSIMPLPIESILPWIAF